MPKNNRVKMALSHEQPDRTLFFEYVLLSPVADCLIGRPYRDYAGDFGQWLEYARETGWEHAIRRYAVDRVDLAEKLGHDVLYVVPNPLPQAVEKRCGAYTSVSSSARSRHPFDDDPVASVQNRIEADLAEMEAPQSDDGFIMYEFVRDELERRGMELYILAPAYYHGVWTDTDLLQTIVLSPDTAHRHFETATRKALKYIEAYNRLGIELIGVGGDFAGKCPIISPESYRTFIVPEVSKLSERIRHAGCYSVNASDGNLWPVIGDFLHGCGVDGYLEIDANARMSLKELKAAYGNSITFFGNMDCGQVLLKSGRNQGINLQMPGGRQWARRACILRQQRDHLERARRQLHGDGQRLHGFLQPSSRNHLKSEWG